MEDNYVSHIIPLISRCRKENISISLLLTVLRLIERGLISQDTELKRYLDKRAERNPKYVKDAKKINELIVANSFLK